MIETLFEILIITVLVVANGVLAAAEIGVVSSSKIRLHRWSQDGDERAARALELAESPNRFLSTVQIGITSVAVLAGAFGGARIAATLAPGLAGAGVPERFAHEAALLLVVVGITYLTLVIGELVPKRIALHDPERLARTVASPMLRLAALAAPLVRVLSHSTELVLRLIPLEPRDEAGITEEEIRGMIAHATETGVLEPTEQQIVERLFRLSDATVESIMVPRDVVAWLDSEADPETWRPLLLSGVRHTRFLVAEGDLDSPVGYVMIRDMLQRLALGEPPSLEGLVRQPHVLPAWTPVFRLLERFQRSGDHIAIITGEDGRVAGLATLNDVLAGIVGDMPPMQEPPGPRIVERDDGSWLVDGLIPFDEFLSFFGRTTQAPGDFATLHAFVKDRAGPVARADVMHWAGLRLEVVDMDGERVDQVLVSETVEEGATRAGDVHWRW
ncbi:MAG: hemolysin family protein [Gemmatimonadota bacterium]